MSARRRLVRDYAFDVLGLTTLRWRAMAGNWGSRRVAAAAGFVFDGTVRRLLDQRGTLRGRLGGHADQRRPAYAAPGPGAGRAARAPGLVLRPFTRERRRPHRRGLLRPADPALAGHRCPGRTRTSDALDYLEHTRELAARGTGLVWCIADADDDRCLGSIGLEGLGSYAPRAEIGYWAHPEARGRGHGHRGGPAGHRLRPVGRAGHLDRHPLRRGEHASRHVAEAAGYREIGRMPEAEPVGDGGCPSWSSTPCRSPRLCENSSP